MIFNIYCDESCHLENDHQPVMVLGAVWCPLENTREIGQRIKEIKQSHGIKPNFEIKWTKISPAKIELYIDVVNYFLENNNLHFRSVVVANKSKLQHDNFIQTHDTFYYKMFFNLLKVIFEKHNSYHIYFDIKDTNSASRMAKLHDVLCNSMYDFDHEIIQTIQTVRSHEVQLIQLADVLTGIISYANRGLKTSAAKSSMVKRLQEGSGYTLTKTTLFKEDKVNLFIWQPLEDRYDI